VRYFQTLTSLHSLKQPISKKDFRLFQFITVESFISGYEMKQISADFHLISRLRVSHLNCHSYKSH
jgi:hypothetical protein